ncbi:hypothetical protein CPB86DRAFT_194922 [Serendipita vermifera]|nr:hypothetical protein CPB86DRAFT_194922 [Serendipita vermifera]
MIALFARHWHDFCGIEEARSPIPRLMKTMEDNWYDFYFQVLDSIYILIDSIVGGYISYFLVEKTPRNVSQI